MRNVVQDPRRDAAAILALLGLIAFCGVPLLTGRWCDSQLVLPSLTVGPMLLVATLVVRLGIRRAGEAAFAVTLFVLLFLVEIGIAFFVSVDHCGLELG